MFRIRTLAVPGVALALAASCASSDSTTADPPGGEVITQPPTVNTAVTLGVTVDAYNKGKPTLVRAVIPRKMAKGMNAEQAARDHVAALTPLWLTHQRASETVTKSVQTLRNGGSIVRLQQKVNGVDIRGGEIRVMLRPDGSFGALSGSVRADMGRAQFKSNPTDATNLALDEILGKGRVRAQVTEAGEKAGFRELNVASPAEYHVLAARAKKELLPEGERLRPIWTVETFTELALADGKTKFEARRLLIEDGTGKVVRNIDLTRDDAFVYRALADSNRAGRPLDGALQSLNPHPTGEPGLPEPPLGPYNLVVAESFNGPGDPWLPPNATSTSGNNVVAFADVAPPVGVNPGVDVVPEVRGGRAFPYTYDFTQPPLANVTQQKAAAVNLFYMNNWLHDFWYDSGFTEAAGNAQVSNYGRGGIEGDPIIARAQADALVGERDNARMSTPSDGFSPIMHMFLWTGGIQSSLVAGEFQPKTTTFDNGPTEFSIEGEFALAVDQTGGTNRACGPVTDAVAGKIALFKFDQTCGSGVAVNNLAAAGAAGVIAMIDLDTDILLAGSATAGLPGLVVNRADGNALIANPPPTVTLSRSTKIERDGSFDNGIVSHEWGHYLHLRLAQCESTLQCFAMSEGWGDFIALHMMLRDDDDREGTFGVGSYSLFAGFLIDVGFISDPGFFGIRRFAYSIDRSKNDLSLRHIGDDFDLPTTTPINPGPVPNGNSEVHNAGEVWATMLWELYNIIIDEHPRAEARRRMADYVVAGLQLTPPEATFTEARDAILAAAAALDSDDAILIAAAFAGRGAGTCAVAPDRDTFDNTGVVESGTLAAKLETSGVSLTDDGTSCDNDGFLDPGESGTLHITLSNSGPVAAEGITLTATTTTPGVTLGRAISVPALQPFSQLDVAIPVRLAATAPTNAFMNIAVNVRGDAGCGTGALSLNLSQRIGVDELAGVSRSDNLETNILAWTFTGEGASDTWGRFDDIGNNHVLFGFNSPFISDTAAVTPVLSASPTEPLVVTVQHAFALEAIGFFGLWFDGLVVEVTNDGGATWRDVTEVGVDPRYNGTLSTAFGNPLAGRDAFSDINDNFPNREPLVLNFGTQFAGQNVQVRFRMGTDDSFASQGYEFDDISVTGTTNTPFPGYIAEPTRCTGRATAGRVREGVLSTRTANKVSLDGIDLLLK